jgi:signal transduction histidine kinase
LVTLKTDIETKPRKLPSWTFLASLIIIHIGTEISLVFKYDEGVADYYLPTAFSLILINWWGPLRVIPAMYINAVASTFLWGIPTDRWPEWFLYGIPETIFTTLSWYLFTYLYKGKYWLPDIQNTLMFLVLAILVPIIPEIFLLQTLLVSLGDQPITNYWDLVSRNWLGEITSSFGLSLPVLYYVTPFMQRSGLLINSPPKRLTLESPLTKVQLGELFLIFSVLTGMVFTIDFEKFWYLYGLIALYTAIRFGFGPAVVVNYYIFLLTYILPKFFKALGFQQFERYPEVINVFLGASLLFGFSAITGRVISDVRKAERKLQIKNHELDQTNRELDRFVYSVSHDLSAPLKSILGLVNISRITQDPNDHVQYLSQIETSVRKLESFITEILDYSKNNRQQIVLEQIKLTELCTEILDNLKFTEDFNKVKIDFSDLVHPEIVQDKMRLKIILNNLLTNAVKFQKRIPGHEPVIKVSTRKAGEKVVIEIEDNGEGIRHEMQSRIFDMFFRGSDHAKGSGLGLYIAKEAALRIHGNISFRSEYGKGSVFTVELKNLNLN